MVVRADFVLIDQIPVQIIQLSVALLHGHPTVGERKKTKRTFGPKVKQSSHQV